MVRVHAGQPLSLPAKVAATFLAKRLLKRDESSLSAYPPDDFGLWLSLVDLSPRRQAVEAKDKPCNFSCRLPGSMR